MHIILASTSPFRQKLLNTLGLPFTTAAPEIDESRLPQENAAALVQRLAREKATAIAATENDFVIGSDQVATLDGEIIGKPHTMENAERQLTRFSRRCVQFYTGLSLRHRDRYQTTVVTFNVYFRALDPASIKSYLNREQPLNCAGSFKAEGLGILLFERLEGDDPNSLIGLPLIALNQLFTNYGVDLLTDAAQFT
ncbi:Maf family protein [Dichelobacter nodosus]|uniref:7-methyl-GTP pyrophosphatase n=1 Tax=Dichelobacter nodosus (strain VCS1703A) TaxID=246195 RepID=A5EY01_DICNV|nr:nucleoside triphosphate pyrophosphatase [Dichelobacter nodosus]ABQ14040.1 Maf-like protein [Dichelobacter nodosus VCS1703A]AXM45785.1 septum formation inhibitor Maf [Dichelobacter nodosus]KNZ39236.1 septum formation inhibitor Maf [Dichelobacter nodosus]TGA64453.1 septum formation inhibitor Maf [Dichelobacter nodosus]